MDLATVRADRLRCAHCRDGVSGLADVCVSCRAVYHENCALELGRCCPERVESEEGPVAKAAPETPSSRAPSGETSSRPRAPLSKGTPSDMFWWETGFAGEVNEVVVLALVFLGCLLLGGRTSLGEIVSLFVVSLSVIVELLRRWGC